MEKEYTREELDVLIAEEELTFKEKVAKVLKCVDTLIAQYQKGDIDPWTMARQILEKEKSIEPFAKTLVELNLKLYELEKLV